MLAHSGRKRLARFSSGRFPLPGHWPRRSGTPAPPRGILQLFSGSGQERHVRDQLRNSRAGFGTAAGVRRWQYGDVAVWGQSFKHRPLPRGRRSGCRDPIFGDRASKIASPAGRQPSRGWQAQNLSPSLGTELQRSHHLPEDSRYEAGRRKIEALSPNRLVADRRAARGRWRAVAGARRQSRLTPGGKTGAVQGADRRRCVSPPRR
jgi:hypothetical protein